MKILNKIIEKQAVDAAMNIIYHSPEWYPDDAITFQNKIDTLEHAGFFKDCIQQLIDGTIEKITYNIFIKLLKFSPESCLGYCLNYKDDPEIRKFITTSETAYTYCQNTKHKDNYEELVKDVKLNITMSHEAFKYCKGIKDDELVRRNITSSNSALNYCTQINNLEEVRKYITYQEDAVSYFIAMKQGGNILNHKRILGQVFGNDPSDYRDDRLKDLIVSERSSLKYLLHVDYDYKIRQNLKSLEANIVYSTVNNIADPDFLNRIYALLEDETGYYTHNYISTMSMLYNALVTPSSPDYDILKFITDPYEALYTIIFYRSYFEETRIPTFLLDRVYEDGSAGSDYQDCFDDYGRAFLNDDYINNEYQALQYFYKTIGKVETDPLFQNKANAIIKEKLDYEYPSEDNTYSMFGIY